MLAMTERGIEPVERPFIDLDHTGSLMASIRVAAATKIGSGPTRGYYPANQCLLAGTSPFNADICAGNGERLF
jgi:hypothetical protein